MTQDDAVADHNTRQPQVAAPMASAPTAMETNDGKHNNDNDDDTVPNKTATITTSMTAESVAKKPPSISPSKTTCRPEESTRKKRPSSNSNNDDNSNNIPKALDDHTAEDAAELSRNGADSPTPQPPPSKRPRTQQDSNNNNNNNRASEPLPMAASTLSMKESSSSSAAGDSTTTATTKQPTSNPTAVAASEPTAVTASSDAEKAPHKVDNDDNLDQKLPAKPLSSLPSSPSSSPPPPPPPPPQLPQPEEEEPQQPEAQQPEESPATIVSYLLEEGKMGADGKVIPTTLSMTLTTTTTTNNNNENNNNATTTTTEEEMIRLRAGDDVVLFQDETETDDNDNDETWPPARIQGFVEKEECVFFTAQWFLSKKDIQSLPRIPWTGVLTRSELLRQMEDNEIVLSNSTDENEIGAICGLARVRFGNDQQDDAQSSSESSTYKCRYQLDVSSKQMKLMPYTGRDAVTEETAEEEEDNGSVSSTADDDSSRRGSTKRRAAAAATTSMDEDSDSVVAPVVAAEGEGSTLRESIEVGPNHQAVVPKWNPRAKPKIRSRNPKLVWKPGMFTDEQVGNFLEGVAKHHTPFLDKNRLTSTATYTPVLGRAKLDKLLQRWPERLTGSSLSTASMLAGESKRAKLRKECDVDTLLEIMTDSRGSVERAIDTASMDLDRITRAWTFSEKSLYNEGFRRHQGVLRKIAKSVAPVKSMQDVVDFHYRFKIPDKFRQYQEKKREIAVRIVECMEEKRAYQPPSNLNTSLEEDPVSNAEDAAEARHWSETSSQEVATLTDLRRKRARQLMVNVHEELGAEVLAQVAQCIRQLTESPSSEVRKHLLTALEGSTDLQQRFIEFLP